MAKSKKAESAEAPPGKPSIDLFIEDMAKQGITIHRASDSEATFMLRRPTGVPSLDKALAGGFPAGTINIIDGQESVGKDALINHTLATLQQNYGKEASALVCLTEPSGFDKLWARKMGVKVPLSDEEIHRYEQALKCKISTEMRRDLQSSVGNITFLHETTAEKVYSSILAAVSSQLFQLIIVNSFDVLIPEEYAEQADEEGVGEAAGAGMRKAQLQTEFVNLFSRARNQLGLGLEKPTVLGIMQARANLATGGSWQSRKWSTRHGSHALMHMKTMDVELKTIGSIPERGDPKAGKRIKWTLTKAKLGANDGPNGEYDLYFDSGIDVVSDLCVACKAAGMLTQRGPNTTLATKDGEVLVEGKGLEAVKSRLNLDRDLWHRCYLALLDTLPLPPILKP